MSSLEFYRNLFDIFELVFVGNKNKDFRLIDQSISIKSVPKVPIHPTKIVKNGNIYIMLDL